MSVRQTIATEIQQLMVASARKGVRRTTTTAEGWTARIARNVLKRDRTILSDEARQLTRLHVKAAAVPTTAPVGVAATRMVDNHAHGSRRERVVERLLLALFPKAQGHAIYREQYLRYRGGKIAVDPVTQQSRRIDFIVMKGKEIIRSIEVTSQRVSKALQLAKEKRMRQAGMTYLEHPVTRRLVRLPATVKTTVVRLP